ncbi:hypothetical protein Cgig2_029724 [Carnegiea gigantea]|uniref:GDSL esterase/lipase n=1 Tax=Carnegiea gigantea TaxID=171969 RepID=A0A9Q1QF34_9CARY|nr:hypothetical protein Cgig2_029724 [Carnegiea gigantea]
MALHAAKLLGFDDYVPPYALGGRISFGGQVRNYQNTVSQLVQLLGSEDKAANYLSRCIYSIGQGSNNYLNNYFMPLFYTTSRHYNPEQYAIVLMQEYDCNIRLSCLSLFGMAPFSTLYNCGARKFASTGVGHIGCSPNELGQRSTDGMTCGERINSANRMFNARLKSMVDQFNDELADARFGATNAGRCGVGRNNGQITCLPLQTPCLNRNEYLFWDAFHPGEAANAIIGRRSYKAESPSDAYPFDIQTFAQI